MGMADDLAVHDPRPIDEEFHEGLSGLKWTNAKPLSDGDVYAHFLAQFTPQRFFRGFAGFDLAAGEFPAAFAPVPFFPSGDEDPSAFLDDGGGHASWGTSGGRRPVRFHGLMVAGFPRAGKDVIFSATDVTERARR